MFVPGLGPGDSTGNAVLTSLSNSVDSTTGFRSNVGVYNASDAPQSVAITLFGNTGQSIGRTSFTLGAREVKQINDIFSAVGVHANVPSAYCTVQGDGLSPFYAYAAVVDNQSQDPIFIPGQNDPEPPPIH